MGAHSPHPPSLRCHGRDGLEALNEGALFVGLDLQHAIHWIYVHHVSPPHPGVWTPPKVKFFAWLATRNRIWTADRLTRRGWQNCGLCPLCQRVQENGAHLFYKCRFTLRIWNLIKNWLGLHMIDMSTWDYLHSLSLWWRNMSGSNIPNRKAMASLTMLVGWII